ncbi:uncharacterized protein BP5553_09430 [Venustampulla echinocandica]|uniref:Major facilitator superfamily (MFS) profile domain-containing protein n=1 Tax=Venustampulla echinocandica TaxID=2656787 RepID=A0A370TCQ0_9HELO|nr:uncharacterized protein BP5553_09430 [Venustampulla echinocandica]RDL32028.1 hypothetical protein BP5553_09430 [Venustampulla echinocandica]
MAPSRSGSKDIILGDLSSGSVKSSRDEASITQKAEATSVEEEISETVFITGWSLGLITFAQCLALFVAQMESSIVSTSILAITNELGGFNKSSWVFTAFLLTYSGLVIIWAKMSDIFGRKRLLLVALILFIVFSGACGAAQTLIQLIMFRCIQGIGGSGIFSLAIIIWFEIVPPRDFPKYTALVTVVFTFSVTFGPLIGGSLTDHTTWRWIFLLNVPLGFISLVILFFLLPTTLPAQKHSATPLVGNIWSLKNLQRIDFIGATLLLGGCVLLVTALQQAADGISFAAAVVLSLLILSGVFWVAFVIWQWFITTKRELPEPVFPWRFFSSRVFMGMILNTFFAGTILTVLTIQLPQRFQTVNGNSALIAGVRLISFGLLAPASSAISATIIGKTTIPPIWHILLGSFLEIVGTVGLSKTPTTYAIAPQQYVFQVITGVGVGFCNAALMLLVPNVVEKRDLGEYPNADESRKHFTDLGIAVGTAAITQFRVLGGIMGLAIVISVMNRAIQSDLLDILPVQTVDTLLQTTEIIHRLPPSVQESVRLIFARGYNLQMTIMIGFAAAQVPSTMLMWTRKPIMVEK